MQDAPDQLIAAVNRSLPEPHETKIDLGHGAYEIRLIGTKPEKKLATVISIAHGTRSGAALNIVSKFADEIVSMWSHISPEFPAAVNVLGVLNTVKWQELEQLGLHRRFKKILLEKPVVSSRSGDIAAFVYYADQRGVRWTDEDRAAVVSGFEGYLRRDFNDELFNCGTAGELDDLSAALDGIAIWCGVEIEGYQDAISERREELSLTEDDNGDEVHQWHEAGQPIPEWVQEEEVKRLFDGLRSA